MDITINIFDNTIYYHQKIDSSNINLYVEMVKRGFVIDKLSNFDDIKNCISLKIDDKKIIIYETQTLDTLNRFKKIIYDNFEINVSDYNVHYYYLKSVMQGEEDDISSAIQSIKEYYKQEEMNKNLEKRKYTENNTYLDEFKNYKR